MVREPRVLEPNTWYRRLIEGFPDGIVAIGAWLARYRAYWPKRMGALADLLKDMDQ